jgi:hypothetical protein
MSVRHRRDQVEARVRLGEPLVLRDGRHRNGHVKEVVTQDGVLVGRIYSAQHAGQGGWITRSFSPAGLYWRQGGGSRDIQWLHDAVWNVVDGVAWTVTK